VSYASNKTKWEKLLSSTEQSTVHFVLFTPICSYIVFSKSFSPDIYHVTTAINM